jgi:vitamin-K-epoxide reductase (warfarin-sensitive)
VEHYTTAPQLHDLVRSGWSSAYVNQSPYATAYGIPVALLGIAGYSLVTLLEFLHYRMLAAVLAGIGLIYALYLTHVEAHILHMWCFSSLASLLLIAAITLLAFVDSLSGPNPLQHPGHRA